MLKTIITSIRYQRNQKSLKFQEKFNFFENFIIKNLVVFLTVDLFPIVLGYLRNCLKNSQIETAIIFLKLLVISVNCPYMYDLETLSLKLADCQ